MKFLIILLVSFLSLPSHAEFIPEASGVCRLGETLVISGDEESKALWLSTQDGALVKVKVKEAWDDLESLAAVDGGLFFASTSHSRTKKGKRKPEREKLMLLQLDDKNITPVHTWSLREQVLSELQKSFGAELDMKTVESASPDDGGLNIEGLAYRAGKLYLGLRSPVTSGGKAIVLVIKNADELLQGKLPVFDPSFSLDLAGRGVRGLDQTEQGLLVLSGSHNDIAESFGLGALNLQTRMLSETSVRGFEALLRPEGVVAELNGATTFVQDFEEPQSQDVIVRLNR